MPLHLGQVTSHGSPSRDLTLIFAGDTPAHVIAAIPLEPPARVVLENPSLLLPLRKREAGVHLEIVQFGCVPRGAKLGVREPIGRELAPAIGQVLASKDSESEHLLGCELRPETWMKSPAHGLDPFIPVAMLHPVVDDNKPSRTASYAFRSNHDYLVDNAPVDDLLCTSDTGFTGN